MSFSSWPTLDPLHHRTEGSGGDEDTQHVDLANLDVSRAPAGFFASYHAYPYYPDFMMLDPGYGKARSPEGRSSYFGYLRELVQHHAAIPTVISEYGVPSSRGTAHLHPLGWGHGGHDVTGGAAWFVRVGRDAEPVAPTRPVRSRGFIECVG